MLHFVISILGIFITIFFVIGTHEYAHFQVARLLNIKVLRFSIGFGKTLWRRVDKKGTEYVLALVPLGGYVKMLDENEGTVAPHELTFAFNRQPFYKKFLVVIAGPLTNIFCAFILYWCIFVVGFNSIKPIIGTVTPNSIAAMSGLKPKQMIVAVDNKPTATWTGIIFRLLAHAGDQDTLQLQIKNPDSTIENHQLNLTNWHINELTPDPLSGIGITPYSPEIPLIIGIIAAKSPAASSVLQLGDKLIAINHQPIKDWDELINLVTTHPGEEVVLSIERQNKPMDIKITIGYQRSLFFKKTGYLGIAPKFDWPADLLQTIQYSPLYAFAHAWREISDFTYFNLLIFGKMITGKLSLQSLGGPITIFQTAGDALNSGLIAFIGFLAFLSISIGIINLLPIPGLDGGHLLFQTIEFIIQRPVPESVLLTLYRLGFLLILFVLLQAVVNDLLRL